MKASLRVRMQEGVERWSPEKIKNLNSFGFFNSTLEIEKQYLKDYEESISQDICLYSANLSSKYEGRIRTFSHFRGSKIFTSPAASQIATQRLCFTVVKTRKRKTRPWRQALFQGDKVERTTELWSRTSLWSKPCGDPEDSLSGVGQFSVLQETTECLMCLNTARRYLCKWQKVSIRNMQKTNQKNFRTII